MKTKRGIADQLFDSVGNARARNYCRRFGHEYKPNLFDLIFDPLMPNGKKSWQTRPGGTGVANDPFKGMSSAEIRETAKCFREVAQDLRLQRLYCEDNFAQAFRKARAEYRRSVKFCDAHPKAMRLGWVYSCFEYYAALAGAGLFATSLSVIGIRAAQGEPGPVPVLCLVGTLFFLWVFVFMFRQGTQWIPVLAALRNEGANFEYQCRLGVPMAGCDFKGRTPIDVALMNGESGLLLSLLHHGLKPNETDEQGNTLLHWAVRYRSPASVMVLMDAGADPMTKNAAGVDAFDLAKHVNSSFYDSMLSVNPRAREDREVA